MATPKKVKHDIILEGGEDGVEFPESDSRHEDGKDEIVTNIGDDVNVDSIEEDNEDYDDAQVDEMAVRVREIQHALNARTQAAQEEFQQIEVRCYNDCLVFYKQRAELLRKIPGYWANAFAVREDTAELMSDQDIDILYSVDDFFIEEDIMDKSWLTISMTLRKNEFIGNHELKKQYRIAGFNSPIEVKGARVEWLDNREQLSFEEESLQMEDEGNDGRDSSRGEKRVLYRPHSFFDWFEDETCEFDSWNDDPFVDLLMAVWRNPLTTESNEIAECESVEQDEVVAEEEQDGEAEGHDEEEERVEEEVYEGEYVEHYEAGEGDEHNMYEGEGDEQVAYEGEGDEQVAYDGEGDEQVAYEGEGDEHVVYDGEGDEQVVYDGEGDEQGSYEGEGDEQVSYEGDDDPEQNGDVEDPNEKDEMGDLEEVGAEYVKKFVKNGYEEEFDGNINEREGESVMKEDVVEYVNADYGIGDSNVDVDRCGANDVEVEGVTGEQIGEDVGCDVSEGAIVPAQ
eukprot:CFRG0610T1